MITEFGIETDQLKENRIIGDVVCNNSQINFKGKDNILFAEGTVELRNSQIDFLGDNAVVFLSKSNREFKIKIDMWRETTAYFGSNNYFNGPFNAIVSERKNLIVGNDGVFSFGIWVRTADPHLIYSIESKERLNKSKSITIGDHVWLGQNALILKGSQVGSGSVVSANCVLAGKKIESNTIVAGNPARTIKRRVFFIGDSVHNYTSSKTKKSMKSEEDYFIYNKGDNCINVNELDKHLRTRTSEEKLNVILNELAENKDKNRFYVAPAKVSTKNRILRMIGR